MSDPVGDRLRDYYRSIASEAPARLDARASQVMTAGGRATGRRPRPAFRFAAGGAAVVAIVAIVAIVASLAIRNVSPNPAETPSAALSPTPVPSASPTLATAGPSATPTAEPTSSPAPSVTPTPAPTATPTVPPTPTTATAVGSFGKSFTNPVGRSGYTVTTMLDGRVLIVGGIGSGSGSPVGRLSIAQVWDPASGRFTATGSTNVPRCQHTATLLDNGKVLIVGGGDLMDGIDNLASAELYDPTTGKFTLTGSMSAGRAFHTATRLEDGRVLVVGGYGGGTEPMASAELYDPATGKFSKTGSMSAARDRHSATYLGGRVLIAGGMGLESKALASAEIFDPSAGSFTPTEPMNVARYGHAATEIADPHHPEISYSLIAGGMDANGKALASAEVYSGPQGNFGLTKPMHLARSTPQAVAPSPGMALVVGGNSSTTGDFFNMGGTFRATAAIPGSGETATVFGQCQVLLSASGGRTWQVFTASDCPPAT